MQKFIIAVDSASDLSNNDIRKMNIQEICFPFSIDNKEYKDIVCNDDMLLEAFNNNSLLHTSQINPSSYFEFFKSIYEIYKLPILYICLASGLSNTINSANMSLELLKDYNPNIKVKILDSKIASLGIKILADKAYENINKDIDKVYDILEELSNHLVPLYTTDKLDYFVKGGRLSKFEGMCASLLQIRPVMTCKENGSLEVVEKVRTSKNVINKIIEMMKEKQGHFENQTLYIATLFNQRLVDMLLEEINKNFKFKDIQIRNMGIIIGSHTGPGLVSVFFTNI